MRPIFKVVLGAAILCAIVLGLATAQSYLSRLNADAFLTDIKQLRISQSSLEDVLRIQARYRIYSQGPEESCSVRSCSRYFYFDNRWLYYLHLSPGTRFGGGMTITDGVLSRVSLSMVSNSRIGASVEETIANDKNGSSFQLGGRKYSNQRYVYVWIRLTTAATSQQRAQAYSFDTKCLTVWGGCTDANEMLPVINR
jgi:hypothetical protein